MAKPREITQSLQRSSEKPILPHHLHDVLCLCWKEVEVPQGMCNSKLVICLKNKGDRRDYNIYCGISILSTAGYILAWVIHNWLQVEAKRIYPEAQRGFWLQCSMFDMDFPVRQLQEKCTEQRHPLYSPVLSWPSPFTSGLLSALLASSKSYKGLEDQLTAHSIIEFFHIGMRYNVFVFWDIQGSFAAWSNLFLLCLVSLSSSLSSSCSPASQQYWRWCLYLQVAWRKTNGKEGLDQV